MRTFLLVGASLLGFASAAGATTLTKAPDLGTYWGFLGSSGTYVYADSFVAPVTGQVTDLGTWLNGGSSNVAFEILADLGSGSGPNGASVLVSTTSMSFSLDTLTYEDAAPISSATLVAGQTYWFAASTVGLGGSGDYSVGGHSQNSDGINDGGTFWFSNSPTGQNFDGRNLTPEMAFSVTLSDTPVPEPMSVALLGMGISALGLLRQKRVYHPTRASEG